MIDRPLADSPEKIKKNEETVKKIIEDIKTLVKDGADVNLNPGKGYDPQRLVYYAITRKNWEFLLFLLEKNAKLNWVHEYDKLNVKDETYDEWTPLRALAIDIPEIETIKDISKIDTNPNVRDQLIMKIQEKINRRMPIQRINSYEAGPSSPKTIDGGAMRKKYKGRSYKVRTGARGGKYILVNNEKIYV
jgi:hypothetical protein